MTPGALLAIMSLGMVVAYVLPQRMRERSDYALVRTEDRYSADMRVVKTAARRVERATARPSSDSGEVPLLVTGSARASIAALGEATMSRPLGPIDKAATLARREMIALRKDRAGVRAARAARARRRAVLAALTLVAAVTLWVLVAFALVGAVVAALVTSLFGAVVVAGARTAAVERAADSRIAPVAREVRVAAAATGALQRVFAGRAAGHAVAPSYTETQAIRVVTAADLTLLEAPLDAPVVPAVPAERGAPWSPPQMPVPSYSLQPTVRARVARPLSEADYSESALAAGRSAAARDDAVAMPAAEAAPHTATLDQILKRRRAQSA